MSSVFGIVPVAFQRGKFLKVTFIHDTLIWIFTLLKINFEAGCGGTFL
jgi:hypothetical protein